MKRVIYADRTLSNQIIAELKQAGIPKKSYMIKTSSDSINIMIADPYVPKTDVESVVNKYENIHYDEYSGEILLGGNTYVFVRYASDAFDDLAKEFMVDAKDAYDFFQDNPRTDKSFIIDTDKGKLFVYKDGSALSMTDNRCRAYTPSVKSIAKYAAIYNLYGTFYD